METLHFTRNKCLSKSKTLITHLVAHKSETCVQTTLNLKLRDLTFNFDQWNLLYIFIPSSFNLIYALY